MQVQAVATVSNVSKKFADQQVIDNVTFSLHQAEVLSVLGPNGAGKTTLINLMLGRLKPSNGEIRLFENKPESLFARRKTGAMLQVANIPELMTVKEHVELFQSYYASPFSFDEIIGLAGLEGLENKLAKKLSGGQRQRVMFALAICGKPALLFLDEPTVGLDINARKSLWKSIDYLKSSGTSIILTTHYLEEADSLSDRIIMLNNGKIIQQGTPEEIKHQSQIKKISFETDLSPEALLGLPAVSKVELVGRGFLVNSSEPEATLRMLFEKTKNISNLTVTGLALEDAFVAINQSHDTANSQLFHQENQITEGV